MSIIPASRLSAEDLSILGNNLTPAARKPSRQLGAVNRSLAAVGEQVKRLYRRMPSAADWARTAPLRVKRRPAA